MSCPTCGSDDAAERLGIRYPYKVSDRPCPDDWHDRPTDRCPRCNSDDPAVSVGACVSYMRYPHPWHDRPTDDDPSTVERIWSVLDAYGMGVMRKDDLDALNARIRELEDAIRHHHDWLMLGNRTGAYSMLDLTLWKTVGIEKP